MVTNKEGTKKTNLFGTRTACDKDATVFGDESRVIPMLEDQGRCLWR
jgi:hypothetical protein